MAPFHVLKFHSDVVGGFVKCVGLTPLFPPSLQFLREPRPSPPLWRLLGKSQRRGTPIPEPAPVTSATFPCSRPVISCLPPWLIAPGFESCDPADAQGPNFHYVFWFILINQRTHIRPVSSDHWNGKPSFLHFGLKTTEAPILDQIKRRDSLNSPYFFSSSNILPAVNRPFGYWYISLVIGFSVGYWFYNVKGRQPYVRVHQRSGGPNSRYHSGRNDDCSWDQENALESVDPRAGDKNLLFKVEV